MQSMELTDKNDFSDGCHMASTDCQKRVCIANRYQWEMHHSKEWCTSDEIPRYSAKEPPMRWECSSECKILSDVCTIIDLDIVVAEEL